MRIAFTSDLHTDHDAANRLVWHEMVALLRDLAPDVFICCGDVAADEQQFGMTLMALQHLPCPKLLVPGNHDIWVRQASWVARGITSQRKYYHLLPALCREAGVHPLWLAPYILDNVGFCGSLGWYDYSLRNEALDASLTRDDYRRKTWQQHVWNDRRFVHWLAAERADGSRPRVSDAGITAHMVRALTQQLHDVAPQVQQIVGVTHMLPFRSMLQYRHEPRADYGKAFMGSVLFGEAFQAFPKVTLVLAGHTHHRVSVQMDAVTALTSPVGYASQWQDRTPLMVARHCLRIVDLDTPKR